MTGSHHWYDGRVSDLVAGREETRRDDDGNHFVVEMSEVGRSPRDEGRSMNTFETQPVAAVSPRGRSSEIGSAAGFGRRIEKMLMVAEQEAAETRRNANRESTAMLERARAEGEALRHDGEQAALEYRAEVDRHAEDRAAELDEREHQLERQREKAQADIERQLVEARREADRIVAEAAGRAEELRAVADQELEERHAEVERQMGWLEESRRAALELGRMLLAQAGEPQPAEPASTGWPPTEVREVQHDWHTVEVDAEPERDVPPPPEPVTPDPVSPEPVPSGSAGIPAGSGETAEAPRSRLADSTTALRRHSPAVTLPPELLFTDSGRPVRVPVEPEDDAETGWSPARPPEDEPEYVVGDHTERMRAVRSSAQHPLPRRQGSGRTA